MTVAPADRRKPDMTVEVEESFDVFLSHAHVDAELVELLGIRRDASPQVFRGFVSTIPARSLTSSNACLKPFPVIGLFSVFINILPVIVGNSIRLASEVESGDALG
jgi:hypothetical protein